MEEKISILNNSGEKLIGLKAVPSSLKEKNPVAVLVHGFGYYKEEAGMFDDIAKLLSEEGIIVYRFDSSGCGESEGDFSKTSLTKLKEELGTIIDFVKKEPNVDVSRMVVI